jgi:hypothetical protein
MDMLSRLAIVLFALLLTIPTKSQEYIPMAVEGAHWIIATDRIETPWLVDDLWEYYAQGDTMINGETYKKVYFRQLEITQEPPPFVPAGDYELTACIRDDMVQRLVYAIHLTGINDFCPQNEEFVLYDFSVSINDTADFCLIPDFDLCVIDTILPGYHLGFPSKWYYTNCLADGGYYEGMGSSYGLLEPMFAPVKSCGSKYIYRSYMYYYCRESPCDLIVSVPEIQSEANGIELFPNPARDIININFSTTDIGDEIRIYDLFGQLITKLRTEPVTGEYQFDLSSFPAGNYLVVCSEGNEVIARKKFVVIK